MANCQSCGMPLSQDPAGGGTNADSSKSAEYCSYCYQQGRFTEPNITSEEMVSKVKAIMKDKFKMPGFISWVFVRKIPKLKRWSA
jgi:Putative zinc ribbon domain